MKSKERARLLGQKADSMPAGSRFNPKACLSSRAVYLTPQARSSLVLRHSDKKFCPTGCFPADFHCSPSKLKRLHALARPRGSHCLWARQKSGQTTGLDSLRIPKSCLLDRRTTHFLGFIPEQEARQASYISLPFCCPAPSGAASSRARWGRADPAGPTSRGQQLLSCAYKPHKAARLWGQTSSLRARLLSARGAGGKPPRSRAWLVQDLM